MDWLSPNLVGSLFLLAATSSFAQVPVSPETGIQQVSQWAQLGNFGILAAIASWLMYWAPKWIRGIQTTREKEAESRVKISNDHVEQIKQQSARHKEAIDILADRQATTVANMIASHNDEIKQMLEAFSKQQQYERAQCADQFRQVMEGISRHAEVLNRTQEVVREVRHEVTNMAQARANERALLEEQNRRHRTSPNPGGKS